MECYKTNCQEKPHTYDVSARIPTKLAATAVGVDGCPQEPPPEVHQNGPTWIPMVGTAV